MEKFEKNKPAEFLRQEEMKEMIAVEQDRITAQLMARAVNMIAMRIIRKEEGPLSDFDLRYFMEILREFACDHEALRRILDGRRDDLNWMADDLE